MMSKNIYTLQELEQMTQNNDPLYETALNDYANILPFHTLLKGHASRSYTEKWYPIDVNRYRNALNINDTDTPTRILHRNLSYSIQYLEFLQKQINELELSSVLHRILNKNFIITGVAILEAIFQYLVCSNNLGSKENQNLAGKIITLKEHPEILNIDKSIYDTLDEFRKLRNGVHLSVKISSTEDDHDYEKYTLENQLLVSQVLYQILTCKTVSRQPELFDFLNTTPNTKS